MKRAALVLLALASCTREIEPPTPPARPSILLITLDTTRADAVGPATPAFNALAARGMRFRQAYAAAPQTLPSHVSMMTGLYPGGHRIHENGRYLEARHPLLAERLRSAGYRTAAFVSSFVLARRFGLGRGFEVYDDDFGASRAERDAEATTARALAYLDRASNEPLFLWVHYFDPHTPYAPPEPYRTRHARDLYAGEVAFMDAQMGRLIAAFERRGSPAAVIIAADHGEALGEHGEAQHGLLLHQPVMRVPLLVAGPGVTAGTAASPVSTRRIFHTILDFAGLDRSLSLRGPDRGEVVAGEAMRPFLSYGWQPQVMAVEGRLKAIMAGRLEVYDVLADPGETRDLAAQIGLSRAMRSALGEYPLPAPDAPAPDPGDEERRRLASLGYLTSAAQPSVRKDAPRPAGMTRLFPIIDDIAALTSAGRDAEAIPLLETILREDPNNLDAALRLATSHSALGHDQAALGAFKKAGAIAPDSADVRTHLALHHVCMKQWALAAPLFERLAREHPERLTSLEGLAIIREWQGRAAEALRLRQKIYTMRRPRPAELVHLRELEMRAR